MKAGLNCVIKPNNCTLSTRDRHAYRELFEPIDLSWLHYNTLKYNCTFEWINLNADEKITLLSFNQDINTISNAKDLTKRVLEKETY